MTIALKMFDSISKGESIAIDFVQKYNFSIVNIIINIKFLILEF